MSNDDFRTVKVPFGTYQKLCDLMARIARHGWANVGVDSDKPPTIWGTVDAALDALSKQQKEKKK